MVEIRRSSHAFASLQRPHSGNQLLEATRSELRVLCCLLHLHSLLYGCHARHYADSVREEEDKNAQLWWQKCINYRVLADVSGRCATHYVLLTRLYWRGNITSKIPCRPAAILCPVPATMCYYLTFRDLAFQVGFGLMGPAMLGLLGFCIITYCDVSKNSLIQWKLAWHAALNKTQKGPASKSHEW